MNRPARARPRTPRRVRRRAGRMLRGASAAVLLAALVVGVPWGLARHVGWPLPDRLPTVTELQLHLFGPLSGGLLLDVLACACWVAWAAFTLDVTRCTAALLTHGLGHLRAGRGRPVGRLSPTHALAALLVGTVALSILGNRVAPREARSAAVAWPVAATAGPAGPMAGPLHLVSFRGPATLSHETPDTAEPGRTVVVRAPDPVTGVHDSLWRIADRTLGSGTRWPEIYEVNRGKFQPGGGTFTRPNLIFPGEELILPAGAVDVVPEPGPPIGPGDPLPTPTHEPAPPLPTEPSTPDQGAPARPPAGESAATGAPPDRVGVTPSAAWDPVAFAGLGLAAAVSAALLIVRRRRRRSYRPGSGRRDDLPAAPVIYQLRLAHLRADHPDHDDPDQHEQDLDEPGPEGEQLSDDDRETGTHDDDHRADLSRLPADLAAPRTASATEDAQRIALSAASTRGLGLTGPGGADALRALLLTLLAGAADDRVEDGPAVRLVAPRDDLMGALGTASDLPPSVEAHDTLADALDVLESETMTRAEGPAADHDVPILVLVARPDGDDARLQAVLDNGSAVGVTALLLGQWRPGGTVHVQRDGTVTATGPGPCTALLGRRLLTLDQDAAGHIVELLHDAANTTTNTQVEALPDPGPDHGDAAVADGVEDGLEVGPPPIEEQEDDDQDAAIRPGSQVPARQVTQWADDRRPLRVMVLGPPRILWHPRLDPADPHGDGTGVEITGRLQPRARELLVHLALHPDGAGRESVATALWPDSTPDRTTNALNTALTRLRQTLSQVTAGQVGDVVRHGDGRLTLDPDLVDVDYWRFDEAVTARRAAGSDEERVESDQLVVDAYGGELAEGTPYPWIEIAREAVRRDAIDSAAALARALVPRDPQRTLDLLEMARAFDPVNEMIYRDIMRLQGRLGRLDAISRTLALLTARLAEIDERPDGSTVDLARRLQQRGTAGQPDDRGAGYRGTPSNRSARAG